MACCNMVTNASVSAPCGGGALASQMQRARRPPSQVQVRGPVVMAKRLGVRVMASSNGQDGNVQVEQKQGNATNNNISKQGSQQQQQQQLQQQQQQQQQPRSKQMSMRRRRPDSPFALLDYWDPFSAGGLRQMMDMMDSLFLDSSPAGSWAPAGGSGSSGMRTPWDVVEDEAGYYVRVDMPGFTKEDVKVSVEDGVLAIAGERDPKKEADRWAAKSYRSFNTRLALPDDGQLENIKAELKNGVLCVTLPKKKAEEKKQVIDVQVS